MVNDHFHNKSIQAKTLCGFHTFCVCLFGYITKGIFKLLLKTVLAGRLATKLVLFKIK